MATLVVGKITKLKSSLRNVIFGFRVKFYLIQFLGYYSLLQFSDTINKQTRLRKLYTVCSLQYIVFRFLYLPLCDQLP